MRRAFVIQLRRKPDLNKGEFEARVDHVDSGCSTHVQTVDEFLDFVVSQVKRSEKLSDEANDRASKLSGPPR
jgi:hypothetical protein